MKSKRILFVLFTSVFALYGCVSAGAFQSNTVNHKGYVSSDTTDRVQILTELSSTDLQKTALQAYGLNTVDTKMYQNVRSTKGVLVTKNDVQSISKQLYDTAKIEKAKQEEEALRKAEQERIEKEAEAPFTPRITTYGLDCYGCQAVDGRGGTAMGVQLDLNLGVLQQDGSWAPGIKYGNYFIVAADRDVPMCSIVKISDHGLSGAGISVDEPIYAMVLDRGGGVHGNHFDLYVGSQVNSQVYRISQGNPSAQIVRRGGQNGSSCAL